MRVAGVRFHDQEVGLLEELQAGKKYRFSYFDTYHDEPVSLTLPTEKRSFEFDRFPPFFEGLLPEGVQLEALLRRRKIDRDDLFLQLLAVGEDMVGAVTVKQWKTRHE